MTASSTEPTTPLIRNGPTPLYVQLAAHLREKVEHGQWPPDHRIPSEKELHRIYGISRVTVRQVLNQLVNEGLLFRVRGKGTFVAQRGTGPRPLAYIGLREQFEQQGDRTATRVLASEVIAADADVAQQLMIRLGEPVHRLHRLRTVDNNPVSLNTSFVPDTLAPRLTENDFGNHQLCVILMRKYNLRMSRITESVESVIASAAEAKLLNARRITPLILIRQQITDAHGQAFEYSRIAVRGDTIPLQFEYNDLGVPGAAAVATNANAQSRQSCGNPMA